MSVSSNDTHSSASGEQFTDLTELSAKASGFFAVIHVQIAANPNDYQAHVDYIQALRASSELKELRRAREAMHKIFPLSQELWLSWLQDEKSLATTKQEKLSILDLYSEAVADYTVISLWKDYLLFAIGGCVGKIDEEDEDDECWLEENKVRSLHQAALHATGTDFASSHIIWNTAVDFEIHLMKRHEPFQLDDIQRIRNMYLERLKVPHRELESTFQAYSSFETLVDNVNYSHHLSAANRIVSQTKKSCDKRMEYESRLTLSQFSLDSFFAYIDYETTGKQHDKMRVRTLYERAIAVYCTDVTLWDSYLSYMMSHVKVKPILLTLTQRAVRNCMWSGIIWSHAIRISTSIGTLEETEAMIQKALESLQFTKELEEWIHVLMAICFYANHVFQMHSDSVQLRTRYEGVLTHLKQVCPQGDPYFRIEFLWAATELNLVQDEKAARNIYEGLAKSNSHQSSLWLDYIAFEKSLNNFDRVRSLYKRALHCKLDYPQAIHQGWIRFEQEHATVNLESYYHAYYYVTTKRRLLSQVMDDSLATAPVEPNETRKRKTEDDQANSSKKAKVKASDVPEDEQQQEPKGIESYYVVPSANAGNMIRITNIELLTDEAKLRDLFYECGQIVEVIRKKRDDNTFEAFIEFSSAADVRKATSFDGKLVGSLEMKIERCRPERVIWSFEHQEERNKIYVSGLWPNIQKSFLRVKFSQFGDVKDIRLVTKKNTAFAYIEYADETSATKSLALDGTELEEGKPIHVAISNPQKRKIPKADKKELYVSNLPFTIKEEDIKLLFQKFGPIKAIRMVHKGTRFSGSAFVEFEDEDTAAKGLILTGSEVGGRLIIVSLADPSIRHGKRVDSWRYDESKRSNSDVGSRKEIPKEEPVKNTVSFIPRSAMKKKAAVSVTKKSTVIPKESSQEINQVGKTQEDFRKMLGM